MSRRWIAGPSPVIAVCLAASFAVLVGCNSHPVDLANAGPSVSVFPPAPSPEPDKVDVLWVIDNSGTMCQEQAALRDEFGQFIDKFTQRNVDLHVGVTTTQVSPGAGLGDPLSRDGQLQATPRPVPSSFGGCRGDEGDPNDPKDGYRGVREAIDAAIACTKEPSKWPASDTFDDDTIACAIDPSSTGPCTSSGPTVEDIADLFPREENGASPYRQIPLVLRTADYRNADGTLDRDGLERDFRCMSYVGTSGSSIEKGLSAAVEAVSPQLTGGTVEKPTDEMAPNHGLLREDAKFALIFMSDENDCSHDGTLDERTTCVDDVCAIANDPDYPDSPLLDPDALADELVANLSASKGAEVSQSDIVVASMHGEWRRYGAVDGYPSQQPPQDFNSCTLEGRQSYGKSQSCETREFGTAYSGDRYERFMLDFDQHYPSLGGGEHAPGLICNPDSFGDYMADIADKILGSFETCITDLPRACQGPTDTTCADYPVSGQASACSPFGETSQFFCESAVQVRIYPVDHSLADLQSHPYCVPGSVDTGLARGGCVVDPSRYSLDTCVGNDNGVAIAWEDDRWFEQLRGYEVEVEVAVAPPTNQ